MENIIATIKLSATSDNIPFTVFKPTGFGHPELYIKKSRKEELTKAEEDAWERIRNRFIRCCDVAQQHNMKLLVDAEESWLQPAINLLVEEMMSIYNKKEALIHTTAQLYLKDKLNYLRYLGEKAKEQNFI